MKKRTQIDPDSEDPELIEGLLDPNKLSISELKRFYSLEKKGLLTDEFVEEVISKLLYGLRREIKRVDKNPTVEAPSFRTDLRYCIRWLESPTLRTLDKKVIAIDRVIQFMHVGKGLGVFQGDFYEIEDTLDSISEQDSLGDKAMKKKANSGFRDHDKEHPGDSPVYRFAGVWGEDAGNIPQYNCSICGSTVVPKNDAELWDYHRDKRIDRLPPSTRAKLLENPLISEALGVNPFTEEDPKGNFLIEKEWEEARKVAEVRKEDLWSIVERTGQDLEKLKIILGQLTEEDHIQFEDTFYQLSNAIRDGKSGELFEKEGEGASFDDSADYCSWAAVWAGREVYRRCVRDPDYYLEFAEGLERGGEAEAEDLTYAMAEFTEPFHDREEKETEWDKDIYQAVDLDNGWEVSLHGGKIKSSGEEGGSSFPEGVIFYYIYIHKATSFYSEGEEAQVEELWTKDYPEDPIDNPRDKAEIYGAWEEAIAKVQGEEPPESVKGFVDEVESKVRVKHLDPTEAFQKTVEEYKRGEAKKSKEKKWYYKLFKDLEEGEEASDFLNIVVVQLKKRGIDIPKTATKIIRQAMLTKFAPAWVGSEDIWGKAKEKYKESNDKPEKGWKGKDWATVTTIYKNMGGKVKKKKKGIVDKRLALLFKIKKYKVKIGKRRIGQSFSDEEFWGYINQVRGVGSKLKEVVPKDKWAEFSNRFFELSSDLLEADVSGEVIRGTREDVSWGVVAKGKLFYQKALGVLNGGSSSLMKPILGPEGEEWKIDFEECENGEFGLDVSELWDNSEEGQIWWEKHNKEVKEETEELRVEQKEEGPTFKEGEEVAVEDLDALLQEKLLGKVIGPPKWTDKKGWVYDVEIQKGKTEGEMRRGLDVYNVYKLEKWKEEIEDWLRRGQEEDFDDEDESEEGEEWKKAKKVAQLRNRKKKGAEFGSTFSIMIDNNKIDSEDPEDFIEQIENVLKDIIGQEEGEGLPEEMKDFFETEQGRSEDYLEIQGPTSIKVAFPDGSTQVFRLDSEKWANAFWKTIGDYIDSQQKLLLLEEEPAGEQIDLSSGLAVRKKTAGIWALPFTQEKAMGLVLLVKQLQDQGTDHVVDEGEVEGIEGILYGLWGDDVLFDDLEDLGRGGAKVEEVMFYLGDHLEYLLREHDKDPEDFEDHPDSETRKILESLVKLCKDPDSPGSKITEVSPKKFLEEEKEIEEELTTKKETGELLPPVELSPAREEQIRQIVGPTEEFKKYVEFMKKYSEDEIWEIVRGNKTDVTEEGEQTAKELIQKGIVNGKMGSRKEAREFFTGGAIDSQGSFMEVGSIAQVIRVSKGVESDQRFLDKVGQVVKLSMLGVFIEFEDGSIRPFPSQFLTKLACEEA